MALRAIRRVIEHDAYSNLAIPSELDRGHLDGRDRALAAELAFGTIRALIRIDAALSAVASRSLDSVDPDVLPILRLGAYQVLFTRIPPHAAVSETVDLAPAKASGFVNAVLRRLSAGAPAPPQGNDDHAVSTRTGLAAWAVTELRRVMPEDEVEQAASALASPAALTLRANTCRVPPEELRRVLRESGHRAEPGRFHPEVLRVAGASPPMLPGYREGWFAIQDEASALVGSALQARPGERVLDACAGPGGKAAHLACTVGEEGAVVAGEVRPSRAELVRRTGERLRVPISVLVQDARRPAVREGSFDAVLVDAPCSGLGAARRRPELLWRPRREDLSGLARLQVAILCGVAPLVRPGGRLVYSVCTFPRAETDAALRAFAVKRPDFVPARVPGPGGDAPGHRLWPHRHGTDAMFFAGFVRRSG